MRCGCAGPGPDRPVSRDPRGGGAGDAAPRADARPPRRPPRACETRRWPGQVSACGILVRGTALIHAVPDGGTTRTADVRERECWRIARSVADSRPRAAAASPDPGAAGADFAGHAAIGVPATPRVLHGAAPGHPQGHVRLRSLAGLATSGIQGSAFRMRMSRWGTGIAISAAVRAACTRTACLAPDHQRLLEAGGPDTQLEVQRAVAEPVQRASGAGSARTFGCASCRLRGESPAPAPGRTRRATPPGHRCDICHTASVGDVHRGQAAVREDELWP